VLDTLLAPVHLLFRSQRFSEAGMKDPRILLALLGFAWLAWKTRAGALRALLVFALAGTLGWTLQAGIYRYAMALELLGALALALVLACLPRWRQPAMLVALVLVSVDTRRPDWNRVDSNAGPIPVLDERLPEDALVVTASGEPLGYLALALPDSVPMLGLNNNLIRPGACEALPRRAAERLAAHRGPVYLASSGDAQEQSFLRQNHGLDAAGACLPVRSAIGAARLCPQVRVAPARPACAPP
jgi:hypothetical protein